jgi:hypothetical protein
MTQDYKHPITPPPELVEQWADMIATHTDTEIFGAAAQWGADQELEACCKMLEYNFMPDSSSLRAARRPKPPSLKKLALEWLVAAEELHKASGIDPEGTIRRALEALND